MKLPALSIVDLLIGCCTKYIWSLYTYAVDPGNSTYESVYTVALLVGIFEMLRLAYLPLLVLIIGVDMNINLSI